MSLFSWASFLSLAVKLWSFFTKWHERREGEIEQKNADLTATNDEDNRARAIDDDVSRLGDAELDRELRARTRR